MLFIFVCLRSIYGLINGSAFDASWLHCGQAEDISRARYHGWLSFACPALASSSTEYSQKKKKKKNTQLFSSHCIHPSQCQHSPTTSKLVLDAKAEPRHSGSRRPLAYCTTSFSRCSRAHLKPNFMLIAKVAPLSYPLSKKATVHYDFIVSR